MNKKFSVMWIVEVAILSALAIVLYNFPKFPLPFFPSILKVQFSMLPTLIGGFALGPVGGVIICVIKFLFKLLTTSSMGVGEIVDLGIGLGVILTTSFVYHFYHNKKGAIFALLTCVVVWTILGMVLNGFFAIPMYMKLYNMDAAGIVNVLSVIPGINETNYLYKYLLVACLPFNLLLSVVVSLVTFLVYKKVSWLFEKMDQKGKKEKND